MYSISESRRSKIVTRFTETDSVQKGDSEFKPDCFEAPVNELFFRGGLHLVENGTQTEKADFQDKASGAIESPTEKLVDEQDSAATKQQDDAQNEVKLCEDSKFTVELAPSR